MTRFQMTLMAVPVALALAAPAARAVHCPLVVKECKALVAKLEKRSGTDMGKLAKAGEQCQEAQRLHEAGQHRASIIEAGQAIKRAGEAQGG